MLKYGGGNTAACCVWSCSHSEEVLMLGTVPKITQETWVCPKGFELIKDAMPAQVPAPCQQTDKADTAAFPSRCPERRHLCCFKTFPDAESFFY